MKPRAYYNDFEPYVCEWLRNLIKAGLIPDGDVDNRSIRDVQPEDLRGYTQCHFFAGIGGWAYALRLAGWPDDREVWTGSCPCQPGSQAGKRKGFADDRHLWPAWFNLIEKCRPATIFGEQVAAWAEWLALARSNLEAVEYAVGAMPVEAASAGAFHLRDRFLFVAHRDDERREVGGHRDTNAAHRRQERREALFSRKVGTLADCDRNGFSKRGERNGEAQRSEQQTSRRHNVSGRDALEWIECADGKFRPVKPGVRLLAHGIPARVAKLRGFGNAIDPRPTAEFIGAYLDAVG